MNKLKNIGISALAGTLVSLSAAQAGGVSVTGSWELSYTNLNHEKVTGNKIGMNKNISFGASGDVSDGGAVTWATTIGGTDAMGLTSASMNINMGGIATLAYDSGTGGYGANAVDNIVPTAWEEIDYGFSTGISDLGAVSASKGVINFTAKAPTAGTGISISYQPRMGGTHQADGATGGDVGGSTDGWDVVIDFVYYDAAHFGMRWGIAGQLQVPEMTCEKIRQEDRAGVTDTSCSTGLKDNPYGGSMYYTMKLGPLSLGTQATFQDPMDAAASGIANKRTIVAGGALTLGTVSLSYGEAWDRYKWNNANRGFADKQVAPDQADSQAAGDASLKEWEGNDANEFQTIKFRGWSAAVNIGPVALKGTRNHVGGMGENASSAPRTHSEVNLSIAF